MAIFIFGIVITGVIDGDVELPEPHATEPQPVDRGEPRVPGDGHGPQHDFTDLPLGDAHHHDLTIDGVPYTVTRGDGVGHGERDVGRVPGGLGLRPRLPVRRRERQLVRT